MCHRPPFQPIPPIALSRSLARRQNFQCISNGNQQIKYKYKNNYSNFVFANIENNNKQLENGTEETSSRRERKKSEMRIFYCQFFKRHTWTWTV